MQKLSKKEWDAIPDSYKGEWTESVFTFRGDLPKCAIGHKTWMPPLSLTGGKTQLWTEGNAFIIEGRDEYAHDPFSIKT